MTDKRSDLADLLLILFRRRRFIILNTLVVSLLVLGATFLFTPRYTAVTTLLPPRTTATGSWGWGASCSASTSSSSA